MELKRILTAAQCVWLLLSAGLAAIFCMQGFVLSQTDDCLFNYTDLLGR